MRKVAAAAGLAGPVLFAVVLLTLTAAQYGFMRSLGWDPVLRPTFDWPSGLSLGPLGWVMTVTFILSGMLLSLFANGLRKALPNRNGQIGSMLMMGAGIAMMGLAFTTDPTASPNPIMPVTWHGRLHDVSFLTLGLLLIPAMILFAKSFRELDGWKKLSRFTWITCALAIPTFALKGIIFYAFLAAMLAWNAAAALNLWNIGS
ncbi:MAG: DUF998 domain-containing protein [Anaerolineales bacterium]